MATIVVNDLQNVTVDGVASGSATDVLTNQKGVAGIRGDLQRALQAWDAAKAQAGADQLAAQLASFRADCDAKVAALRDDKGRLQAKVDDLQSQVDALGGTPLAKQMRRQAERQRALDAKAAAEAEIAAIDAEAVP